MELREIDLRTDSGTEPIKLVPGTRLYAVVDHRDPGTSGPFFYEPGYAVFWHLHRYAEELMPIDSLVDKVPDMIYHQLAGDDPTYYFPGHQWYLLTLIVPQDVVIMFDKLLVDPNPNVHVIIPVGSSNLTTRYQVNVDSKTLSPVVRDRLKKTAKKGNDIFYCGMLDCIATIWNRWGNIYRTTTGTSGYSSIRNPICQARASLAQRNSLNTRYDPITLMSIYIRNPQDIFGDRYLAPIKWPVVWKLFIDCAIGLNLGYQATLEKFRTEMLVFFGTAAVLPSTPLFDLNVAACIAGHFSDVKTFLAWSTYNRRQLTRFLPNNGIQRMMVSKFLPKWKDSFKILDQQHDPRRQDVLGPPKPANTGLWLINSLIFAEDVPTDVIEFEDRAEATNRPLDIFEVAAFRRKQRADRVMKNLYGEEEPEAVPSDGEPRKLAFFGTVKNLLPNIIRPVNSFIALIAVHFACSEFGSMAWSDSVIMRYGDEIGAVNHTTTRMAQQPVKANTNGVIKMFGSTNVIDIAYTIDSVHQHQTWLNEMAVPSFFLEADFGAKVDYIKEFERQRLKLYAYPPQQIRAGGPKYVSARYGSLTHGLLFFKQDKLVAYLKVDLRGAETLNATKRTNATKDGSVEWRITDLRLLVNYQVIDREFTQILDGTGNMYTMLLETLYCRYGVAAPKVRRSPFYLDQFQTSTYKNLMAVEVALNNDNVLMEYSLSTGPYSFNYYPHYMVLCSLIRTILFRGQCDRTIWKPELLEEPAD